jgi:hypothetical protein
MKETREGRVFDDASSWSIEAVAMREQKLMETGGV